MFLGKKLLKVVELTFEGYQVMGRLTVLLKGDKTFEGQVRTPEMGSGIFRMRKCREMKLTLSILEGPRCVRGGKQQVL